MQDSVNSCTKIASWIMRDFLNLSSPGFVEGVNALVQRERLDVVLAEATQLWLHAWRDVGLKNTVLALYGANLQPRGGGERRSIIMSFGMQWRQTYTYLDLQSVRVMATEGGQ